LKINNNANVFYRGKMDEIMTAIGYLVGNKSIIDKLWMYMIMRLKMSV
jgi:hypothetical protein